MARLVAWRERYGTDPDRLETLVTKEGFPAAPDGLVLDAFTLKPFRFVEWPKGFVIWSAGPNMMFDIDWENHTLDEIHRTGDTDDGLWKVTRSTAD